MPKKLLFPPLIERHLSHKHRDLETKEEHAANAEKHEHKKLSNTVIRAYTPHFLMLRNEDIQEQEDHNQKFDPRYSRPSSEISRRNRYINIFPYDFNRVRLPYSPSYINASHINLTIPEISNYTRNYIASQAPLENTASDFWQMCYHQTGPDSGGHVVILMLNPLQEGTRKAYKYWPSGVSRSYVTASGHGIVPDLDIKYVSKKRRDGYTHTILTIIPMDAPNSYKPKVAHHIHYENWPDTFEPASHEILLDISHEVWTSALGEDYRNVMNNQFPIIVHCSAGVGRTGTFITADYLFNYCKVFCEEVSQNDKGLDPILLIVQRLRQQRLMMVQTGDQFIFLYNAAERVYRKKLEEAADRGLIEY